MQIGRAVTIHIAMASSSFQWTSPLKNGQANVQTMTRHARTGKMARNGNSVHFAACALSKISANPKSEELESVDGPDVPSHGCLVRLQSQTCFSHLFDLSRVCECCVPSIIFLATALRAFNRRSSTNQYRRRSCSRSFASVRILSIATVERPSGLPTRTLNATCPSSIASLLLTGRIVSSTIMAVLSDRYAE